MSSQEQILAQILSWKHFLLSNIPKDKVSQLSSQWFPWNYFLGLDTTTRFSVILAVIVCAYIFSSSVWRFGRMILTVLVFAIQLFLALGIIFGALQYRDSIASLLEQWAGKFGL
jgi:hypothetical protein